MAKKRKATSKTLRFEIFKRDQFMCRYCGRTPPEAVLEVDHVIPVVDGGPTEEENLVTSCFECNRGKGKTSLGASSPPLSESKIAQRVEVEEQLLEFNKFLLEVRRTKQNEIAELSQYWLDSLNDERSKDYSLTGQRLSTLKMFAAKIPTARMFEAIDIASYRVKADWYRDEDRWKYFCGVCWKIIKGDGNGQKPNP